ncbi:hypothetical protein Tco_1051146 [Tanacetum coccineum]
MYRSLSSKSINTSAHNQQWPNLELQLAASDHNYNQPPSYSDLGHGPENSHTQSRSDASFNTYAPSYTDVGFVRENSHSVQSQANEFIDINAPSYSDLGNIRENSHSLSQSDGYFYPNAPSYSDFVHVLDNSPNQSPIIGLVDDTNYFKDCPQESRIQSPINGLVDDTYFFNDWSQKSPTDGLVDTDTLTYSDMDLGLQNLHIQMNDGFSFTTENALTDINFQTGGGYDDDDTSIYLSFEQRRQDSSYTPELYLSFEFPGSGQSCQGVCHL